MNQGLGMVVGNLSRSGQEEFMKTKYLRSHGKEPEHLRQRKHYVQSPAEMGYSKAVLQPV